MAQRDLMTLTDEERDQLLAMTKRGKVAARQLSRANILLHADADATNDGITRALHIGMATVERTCKRFVEEGLRPR